MARGLHEAVEPLKCHQVQTVLLSSVGLDQVFDQIHALKPEVLVLAARFQDELQILRARHFWPDSVKAVAAVAAGVQAFHQELGNLAEGVIGPSQWEPTLRFNDIRGPDANWFMQSFQKRYGQIPEYTAAGGFAIGLILKECIERAGSLNDESLYQAAKERSFSTFYGCFRIDPESGRQIGHRITLTQWQEGRKVVLSTDV